MDAGIHTTVGLGLPPHVSGVFCQHETLSVKFTAPMEATSELFDPSSYQLSSVNPEAVSRQVIAVEPGEQANEVILKLDGELTTGADNYKFDVALGLESVAGLSMDSTGVSKTFSGKGTHPEIIRVLIAPEDLGTMLVIFSQAVRQEDSTAVGDALNLAHYAVVGENEIKIRKVAAVNSQVVRLIVVGLIRGQAYNVEVNGVRDHSNNEVV